MMNAKEEFLKHVGNKKVKCAFIEYGDCYEELRKKYYLKLNHSQRDYNLFLNQLDFIYDHGLGSQELFGIIWYEDGSWSERGEYDGYEWWEYRVLPDFPDEVK